jgi:hypothetical protein
MFQYLEKRFNSRAAKLTGTFIMIVQQVCIIIIRQRLNTRQRTHARTHAHELQNEVQITYLYCQHAHVRPLP